MKKNNILLLATCLLSLSSLAQDEHDALRYAHIYTHGTARGMAIGGAVGSIGADFSSLSVNPAGIGLYRKSELNFSPSFTIQSNNGSYLGQNSKESNTRLNFAQAGLVTASAKKGNAYKKSAWKTTAFGIGVNRLATFNQEYSYTGKNYKSSFIERYAEEFNRLGGLNNATLDRVSFPAYAAWETYLVDKDYAGDTNLAKAYVPYQDGLQQTKRVSDRGGMNELAISFGGNYMESLMIGATMGIVRSNFDRTVRTMEEDISGKLDNEFKYVRLTERYNTEGTGVNLKLGAIFRPNDAFRFGLALHTPTKMYFNDVSTMFMESHTDSLKLYNNPAANPVSSYTQETTQVFNYSMNTPYKALASATYIIQKQGFITADLEYIDYASMRYDYGQGFQNQSDAVNDAIKNTYKSAVNLRLGGEVKVKDMALRAGYAFYGSPYQANSSVGTRSILSAGTGYRTNSWFLDATLLYAMHKRHEAPYVLARTDAAVTNATIQQSITQVVLTWGWRF